MKKFIKKTDFIFIAVILLIALILFVINRIYFTVDGNKVVVIIDNVESATYSLDEDISTIIEGVDGGTNTLLIENGKADIIHASCPDKLCVNQHGVSRTGESIVCLPNKVVVKVISSSSDNQDAEIDIIVK